jgi:hypothetical protein
MAKFYKPLDETSGRNRPCLRCFNCKTQTFRDLDKLEEFCREREVHSKITWKRRIIKDKVVQLYWCTASNTGPRLFRVCDKPFIIHCQCFNGGDINEI